MIMRYVDGLEEIGVIWMFNSLPLSNSALEEYLVSIYGVEVEVADDHGPDECAEKKITDR